MSRYFSLIWLVVLFTTACTAGKAVDRGTGNVAAVKQALTTIDTTPANDSLAAFGYDAATPTYGQTITVPSGEPVLQGFTVNTTTVPATAAFRAEVFAWDGAKAQGSSLFESASVSPNDAVPQSFAFDTGSGGVVLTEGAEYVLFITTSKDGGSGDGAVASRNDDPYAGGRYVFTGGGPTTWTSVPWSDLGASVDLAFSATLVPLGATATTTALVDTPDGTSEFGQNVTLTATVSGAGGTPTGTVVFADQATALTGTVALNAAGQASLSTAELAVGDYRFSANYGGSAVYDASASGAVTHTVSTARTTTLLTSSSNPAIVGSSVTLTANVAPRRAPLNGVFPTGTVTFTDAGTALGTVPIDPGGAAALATTELTVGAHALVASYEGDTNYGTSSARVTQVVDLDATTVAVTSSSNPSTYAAKVTFTATATPATASGTPTGTFTFSDGATALATLAVGAAGSAAFTTDALTGGSHSITVTYGGDAVHAAASGSLTQLVNLAPATAVVASATNPSVVGQAVTFMAAVSGAGDTPAGTVTFLDGATSLGTATLNGAGRATFSTAALVAGAHPITARYAGDDNYDADTSPSVAQQVNKGATTTSLASSSMPSLFAAAVTFTATVKPVAPAVGAVTGTVTFRDGATTLGTGAVGANGIATFATAGLAVGTHGISASYSGSTSFNSSTSGSLSQVVDKTGVMATLASQKNPSTFGTGVTFTAKVSSSAGPVPTGTVTFKDGNTLLGTDALDAGGLATFTASALTGGAHTISAAYGGNGDYLPASASVAQSVTVAATSSVLASSTNPSVFGQSVSFTVTVASSAAGSFTGTVIFADGATALGTTAIDASGIATLSTDALAVSTHAITAAYSGDTNFAKSTAPMLSQAVERASSSTALAASSNPAPAGTPVTFTATVTATLPGVGTPSGTVTFKDGETVLGTGTLGAAGTATVSAPFKIGVHALTAEYAGDANFTASVSAELDEAVTAEAASVAVTAQPNPATYGDSVTFSATLDGPVGKPAGQVVFEDGDRMLGTVTADATGMTTFTTTELGGGAHTITAAYGGSDIYAATTGTVSEIVTPASTTIALSSSGSPSTAGESISFTATVASLVAGFTGSVEFFDGATSLGKVALSGAQATLTTSTLAVGGHAISAHYLGDTNFADSTSDPLTETVNAVVTPDAGVHPGDSGTGGVPAMPGNGGAAGAAGSPLDAGTGGASGSATDAGTDTSDTPPGPGPSGTDEGHFIASGSCGCRMSTAGGQEPAVLFTMLGMLGLYARRRRTIGRVKPDRRRAG